MLGFLVKLEIVYWVIGGWWLDCGWEGIRACEVLVAQSGLARVSLSGWGRWASVSIWR